jgi:hypothetical protein
LAIVIVSFFYLCRSILRSSGLESARLRLEGIEQVRN